MCYPTKWFCTEGMKPMPNLAMGAMVHNLKIKTNLSGRLIFLAVAGSLV